MTKAHVCAKIVAVRDMPFTEKKMLAQELLASAYSHDYLTVVEYEQRVQDL